MSPLSVRLLAIAEKHGLMYDDLRTIDEAVAELEGGNWREDAARLVQARMRADGLDNPSRELARFHMKRSHFWAGVSCYAALLAFLLFALFGPRIEQCMLGFWP